jgi:hypothetical protein
VQIQIQHFISNADPDPDPGSQTSADPCGSVVRLQSPKVEFCVKKILKVNVENPGSGDFLTLGSGMSFFRILDPERLVKIWVKNA